MGLSKARANSSFIGSELENSFKDDGVVGGPEGDSEGRSEGRPGPSWLRRCLAFAPLRKTLEYVADMDFGDDTKPRRIVKIYRLLGVKATTPPELFAVKVYFVLIIVDMIVSAVLSSLVCFYDWESC